MVSFNKEAQLLSFNIRIHPSDGYVRKGMFYLHPKSATYE